MNKLITLILFLGFLTSPIFTQDKSCDSACKKFLVCTEKQHNRQLKTDEERKLKAGCLNTCKKKAKEIIACYTESKDSCDNYGACIQKFSK